MIKAALIFSGVPRLIKRSRINFMENVVNVNDIDIYSYVWRRDEYSSLPYYYQHRDFEFIEPKNFDEIGTSQFNIYPHWYGLKVACDRFTAYAKKHNLHYDMVIRTRHDIALFHKINLDSLDPNLVHVSNCHWPNMGTEIFDDNLCILSMENYQKIYGYAYDWYIARPNRNFNDVSEAMLAQYIRELGMIDQVTRNSNLDFILTRGCAF